MSASSSTRLPQLKHRCLDNLHALCVRALQLLLADAHRYKVPGTGPLYI